MSFSFAIIVLLISARIDRYVLRCYFILTDKLGQTPGDMVDVAQLVRAPGCGPGGRGFDSPHSPFLMPMSQPQLQLISPRTDLADEYRRMVGQFTQAGEEFHQYEIEDIEGDFAAYVNKLEDRHSGRYLPEDAVPCSTYWLMAGDELVGTARLRHRLTEKLKTSYGNIGYDIKPSARGKGFATKLLAMVLEKSRELGLEKARGLGLKKVMLTCITENKASIRVIEKNGGVFQDEVHSPTYDQPLRRYWIELS